VWVVMGRFSVGGDGERFSVGSDGEFQCGW
jgi:hypothetical protein